MSNEAQRDSSTISMPDAPAEAATAWFGRMAKGAALVLAATAIGLACYPLVFVPHLGWLLHVAATMGVTVVFVCGWWMLTTPVPGHPYFKLHLRWAARLGIAASLAVWVIWLLIVATGMANQFAALYAGTLLVAGIGGALMLWYLAHVAMRLGDWLLKMLFALWALTALLQPGAALMDWPAAVQSARYQLSWHSQSFSMSLSPWLIWLAVQLLSLYTLWRLWRRVRQGQKIARGIGPRSGQ